MERALRGERTHWDSERHGMASGIPNGFAQLLPQRFRCCDNHFVSRIVMWVKQKYKPPINPAIWEWFILYLYQFIPPISMVIWGYGFMTLCFTHKKRDCHFHHSTKLIPMNQIQAVGQNYPYAYASPPILGIINYCPKCQYHTAKHDMRGILQCTHILLNLNNTYHITIPISYDISFDIISYP